MAEIDTSIYKPQPGVDPFAVIKNLQGVEQQHIAIDQAKLKLINDRYAMMNNVLGSLISDPALSWDKVAATGQHLVRMGIITPDMWTQQLGQFAGSTGDPQKLKGMLTTLLSRNLETQNQVNWHYPTPVQNNTGDAIVTRAIGQNPNVPVRGVGAPLPMGQSPETLQAPTELKRPDGTIENTTREGYQIRVPGAPNPRPMRAPDGQIVPPPGNVLGRGRPVAAPVAAPPPMGGMPAAGPPSGGVPAPAPVMTAPLPPIAPAGPAAAAAPAVGSFPGPDPGRIEAEKIAATASGTQMAKDREIAAGYQERVYPLKQVIKGLDELGTTGTGPGTAPRHALVNFAVSNGVLSKDTARAVAAAKADETNKYMVQYVNNNGNLSTNDKLASAIAGSPNMTISNSAAGVVARAALAIEHMNQAAIMEAQTYPAKDYELGKAKIKNNLDPRAFAVDTMSPEARAKLRQSMPDGSPELQRFRDSMKLALRHKLISLDPPKAP